MRCHSFGTAARSRTEATWIANLPAPRPTLGGADLGADAAAAVGAVATAGGGGGEALSTTCGPSSAAARVPGVGTGRVGGLVAAARVGAARSEGGGSVPDEGGITR